MKNAISAIARKRITGKVILGFAQYAWQKMYSSQEMFPLLEEEKSLYGGHSKPDSNASFSLVSLFSGCGGFDLGFVGDFWFGGKYFERLPFDICWANDIDEAACDTYRRNLGSNITCGDITSLLSELPPKADVLIGGFPCQDVSINGSKAANEGTRSTLYRAMHDAIRRTNPRIFVAENVSGILMAHSTELFSEMMTGFEELGYSVSIKEYLAADYGVPQMRKRVLFVGTKKKKKKFEHPDAILEPAEWLTVKAAIADLELLEETPEFNHIWSKAKPSPQQGQRRLSANKPSTTIRAECHGNQQFHYARDRRISLREAARLQSFPDTFEFTGGMRRTERQIGNAVPPVLAWHLAKAIGDYLL